ncbi:MAG TPA: glycerol-3-phosphate responsive antiterminator [Ktedonobacteraceae bacterium]|nr:glycerol-3-phosphate responsive antiterminator [Ktedonobacteraceae bacterium]
MLTRSTRPLLNLPARQKTIPLIENRTQFALVLESSEVTTIMLRHCNLFDLRTLLNHAHERELAVYVNMDHIDGIMPDLAGLRYLATQLHITGVLSSHGKVLAQAKSFDLQTIQRIFAVDSTGLEVALESVDEQYVDLLAISPALVIPYAVAQMPLHLPFIGCGFVSTPQQVQRVLRAGAIGVTVTKSELWT